MLRAPGPCKQTTACQDIPSLLKPLSPYPTLLPGCPYSPGITKSRRLLHQVKSFTRQIKVCPSSVIVYFVFPSPEQTRFLPASHTFFEFSRICMLHLAHTQSFPADQAYISREFSIMYAHFLFPPPIPISSPRKKHTYFQLL